MNEKTPTFDCRSSNSIEVSVVMPCLNEVLTVGHCIEKAQSCFKQLGIRGEVVVADNGSHDGSVEVSRGLGARVVEVRTRGYGSAIRGGVDAAMGQFIIMGDADGSYDFTLLEPFLQRLQSGDDLILGNRFAGGIKPKAMPWLHRYVGNPLLSGLLNLLFFTPIRDAHCGLRAFRKDSFIGWDLVTSGMELASEMVIKARLKNSRMSEVPIILYPDGRDRPPHLRSFRDGWRHLKLILKLRFFGSGAQ